jgi:hypothetical protein
MVKQLTKAHPDHCVFLDGIAQLSEEKEDPGIYSTNVPESPNNHVIKRYFKEL